MKTKNVFLVGGSVVLIALSALGGNGLEGTDIGPFNVPPFFLTFSFTVATWAAYFLAKRMDDRLGPYIEARRNPWRRVVVPFMATIGAVISWLAVFTAGILFTAPQENAEAWLRLIGAP